jgi:peptidoglycan/xylan/chitin deacetylase (PgdA/CDA1 family)
MKIYVLGSNAFMHDMVAKATELCDFGHDGWIHPDYIAYVRGELNDQLERNARGEQASVKRENDYIRVHYKHILESDAILIVNNTKNGINNYIGGNALMEMGQAYVNGRKIFLLNDIPRLEDLNYATEIEAMDPICLHGDLAAIK